MTSITDSERYIVEMVCGDFHPLYDKEKLVDALRQHAAVVLESAAKVASEAETDSKLDFTVEARVMRESVARKIRSLQAKENK